MLSNNSSRVPTLHPSKKYQDGFCAQKTLVRQFFWLLGLVKIFNAIAGSGHWDESQDVASTQRFPTICNASQHSIPAKSTMTVFAPKKVSSANYFDCCRVL
jgi:hypothetical protein